MEQNKIDWSKPIRVIGGDRPAKLIYTVDKSKTKAPYYIVSYMDAIGDEVVIDVNKYGQDTTAIDPFKPIIENVQDTYDVWVVVREGAEGRYAWLYDKKGPTVFQTCTSEVVAVKHFSIKIGERDDLE